MSHARAVVEVIARTLADHPEHVAITEEQHRGTAVLELYMEPGDLGRVIGRQGRTATALRTLVALAADRDGHRVQLEFRDWPPAGHDQ
ncbi:MAG: KH domain-containing protein [Luteitalea sp.]|nr:KH domain-containing protein [Luteitalea sp.]